MMEKAEILSKSTPVAASWKAFSALCAPDSPRLLFDLRLHYPIFFEQENIYGTPDDGKRKRFYQNHLCVCARRTFRALCAPYSARVLFKLRLNYRILGNHGCI